MSRTKYFIKIFIITILICVSTYNINISQQKSSSFSSVIARPSPWNITLNITETTGARNSVKLGEYTDASNGQDSYDIAEPPAPPQLPNIRAWFSTPFSPPFDNLLYEYKKSPASQAEWNLTILWTPAPDTNFTTNITISWDPDQLIKSQYTSIKLYENNEIIADMLAQTEYIFLSNISIHRYQIICQKETTHPTPESNNIPINLLLTGIVTFSIIIILLFILIKKKRKM